MKRALPIVCAALLFFGRANAQTKYEDSIRALLNDSVTPLDSFSLIVRIEEDRIINGYANIDSANCMRLFKIAQALHSDSLLSISYNWIGNYFENEKGDYTTAMEYFFKAIPL